MEEQIKQLMAVLQGHNGWFASLAAIRGFLALAVPLFNSKLQTIWTEAIAANPAIANSIVSTRTWKVADFTLRVLVGIRLPSENSMLVCQVKKAGDTQILNKPTPTP